LRKATTLKNSKILTKTKFSETTNYVE